MNAPEIHLAPFESGARTATGTAVVIDVFRAFTTAAVAFARGAEAIIMVGRIEEAEALRQSGTVSRAIGERGGIAVAGFDHGNSPAELAGLDLTGETLVQTTSNGTRGMVAAEGTERLYAGSFITAEATVAAIRGSPVTLVAMGEGKPERPVPTIEDELCAHWLAARLRGAEPDAEATRAAIRSLSPRTDGVILSDADVEACLEISTLPFAVRVRREDGQLVARPERQRA